MPPDRPIVIAGGGIAGLTFALALARRRIVTVLLEQAPAFSELGAGIQLSPNAARVLTGLGLSTRIAERAVEPQSAFVMDAARGIRLARLPLGQTVRARHGAPYWSTHRADLQHALLAELLSVGLCDLRTDARLEAVNETGQHIHLTLGDGSTITAGALIGADGLNSTVRQHTLGDGPPRFAGYVAWRAMAEPDALADPVMRASVCLWLGRGAHLVHYPVRGGASINVVAIVGTGDEQSGWSNRADPAHLFPRYAGWPDAPLALMRAAGEWRTWTLYDRPPARRFATGRSVLIGDAAHPVLPFQAQGGALAIEDAETLAIALSRTDHFAAAFTAFERERLARAARVQRQARRNGRIYHLGGMAGAARNLVLGALPSSLLLRQQDWLFGHRV